MSRTQLTLGGVLLLQIVLILVLRSPFTGASTVTDPRPLFPALEAITPAKLEIQGAEGEPLTLVKKGGAWGIDQSGGFPADATKIDGLIDDLKSVTVRRPVVSSSRYHDTFRVDDDEHEARLKVWGEGQDEAAVDLILGTSPNFGITHARRAGEDEVWEIRGIAAYDVRADGNAWADLQLVDVEPDAATYLSLSNPSGSFELRKGEDGAWTAQGFAGALDQDKVATLLDKAGSIRLAEPAGPVDAAAQGFATPAATVVLRWGPADAPEEVTVRIGTAPQDETSQRYVTRSGFAFAGTVWESTVKRLLEEKLGDLHASADVPG
jgi:hypothetical protein